jgi:hypothetical protein
MVRCTLITTLLLFGCETDYGAKHRCDPQGACPTGRVCEPIQGYCVRPGPTDSQDGGTLDVGIVGEQDGAMAPDARRSPSDADVPPDARPEIDAAPVCGDGERQGEEECDLGEMNGTGICADDCTVTCDRAERDGQQYVICRNRSRTAALGNCAAWGGALAAVETEGEFVWLVDALDDALGGGRPIAWVGLTSVDGRDWQWNGGASLTTGTFCEQDRDQADRCGALKWKADPACWVTASRCELQVYAYVCERLAR